MPLTLEKLFLAVGKGNCHKENQVALSATIDKVLFYYTTFLSNEFIAELYKVRASLSPQVRSDGAIAAVLSTGNFDLLPELTTYVVSKLSSFYNPNFLYQVLSTRSDVSQYAHLFYTRRVSAVVLLSDIRNIEPIIRECDFTYTKELDAVLPVKSIVEIARCLALYNKTVLIIGPNLLGFALKEHILACTKPGETIFHSHTPNYTPGVKIEQIAELAQLFPHNNSPYFRAYIAQQGKPTGIVTSEEACGRFGEMGLIDFGGEGGCHEYRRFVEIHGEGIVSKFINYDSQTLTTFVSSLQTRPNFCKNWKPTDICPVFYQQYYGKPITWDTVCKNWYPCRYCKPEEYARDIEILERKDRMFNRC